MCIRVGGITLRTPFPIVHLLIVDTPTLFPNQQTKLNSIQASSYVDYSIHPSVLYLTEKILCERLIWTIGTIQPNQVCLDIYSLIYLFIFMFYEIAGTLLRLKKDSHSINFDRNSSAPSNLCTNSTQTVIWNKNVYNWKAFDFLIHAIEKKNKIANLENVFLLWILLLLLLSFIERSIVV